MKVLVTGGAGYIGSHTSDLLIKQGYDVTVVDNLSTGFKDSLNPKIKFLEFDILQTSKLKEVIHSEKFQAVVHFAAKLSVKESTEQPLMYYQNNVGGMLSLLGACKGSAVKKIIFSSTAAVYGLPEKNEPMTEETRKAPINPYGHSKFISEQILKDVSGQLGISYTILRYFNVAGASDDLLNGQKTKNAYHLIHVASKAAVGLRPTLDIFGTDYSTHDGTCVRDYIHVEDLAELHFLALKRLQSGGHSEVFNCGYGKGYSVKEIVDCVLNLAPIKFGVSYQVRRPGDPDYLVADSTKIKKELNWIPRRQDIELICRSAIMWEQKLS